MASEQSNTDATEGSFRVSTKRARLWIMAAVLILSAGMLEWHFCIVFPAPERSLRDHMLPGAHIAAVLRLDAAGSAADLVSPLFEEVAGIPPWALRYGQPCEVAVTCTPSPGLSHVDAALSLSAKRFGPVLAPCLEGLCVAAGTWVPGWLRVVESTSREGRGFYSLNGSLFDLDRLGGLSADKQEARSLDGIRLEGTHTFEATLDNRDGRIFEVLTVMHASSSERCEHENTGLYVDAMEHVASIRLHADLPDSGQLVVGLRIEFTEDAQEEHMQDTQFLLDLAYGHAREQLAKECDAELRGPPSMRSERTLTGEYRILNPKSFLAHLCGPRDD